jgi:S-adenosylmethionine synthetase
LCVFSAPLPPLIFNLFIMAYLFTSESVSEGTQIADQISDALIDNFLAFDAILK